jgi:hypothetical protein
MHIDNWFENNRFIAAVEQNTERLSMRQQSGHDGGKI